MPFVDLYADAAAILLSQYGEQDRLAITPVTGGAAIKPLAIIGDEEETEEETLRGRERVSRRRVRISGDLSVLAGDRANLKLAAEVDGVAYAVERINHGQLTTMYLVRTGWARTSRPGYQESV